MPVSGDEIRLVLPAEPIYGHIARIAVTRLALQCGLTRAETEDLRIAIDETLVFLLHPGIAEHDGLGENLDDVDAWGDNPVPQFCEPESDTPLVITLTFIVEAGKLVIDASTGPLWPESTADDSEWVRFSQIVAETVDVLTIDDGGRHVRLEKARKP